MGEWGTRSRVWPMTAPLELLTELQDPSGAIGSKPPVGNSPGRVALGRTLRTRSAIDLQHRNKKVHFLACCTVKGTNEAR